MDIMAEKPAWATTGNLYKLKVVQRLDFYQDRHKRGLVTERPGFHFYLYGFAPYP